MVHGSKGEGTQRGDQISSVFQYLVSLLAKTRIADCTTHQRKGNNVSDDESL